MPASRARMPWRSWAYDCPGLVGRWARKAQVRAPHAIPPMVASADVCASLHPESRMMSAAGFPFCGGVRVCVFVGGGVGVGNGKGH